MTTQHATVTLKTPKGHEKRYGLGEASRLNDVAELSGWAEDSKLSIVEIREHTYPIREAMDNDSLALLHAIRNPGVRVRGLIKTGPFRQR
jgi:hypothetical protein